MEQLVLPPNPTKVATKWALINALTAIIITYLMHFLNVPVKSPIQYISYVFFIAYLFLSQKEFKDQLGGFITFGQAFSTGFRYAVFTGLLTAVFIYLYYSILNPEAYDKILEITQTSMEEQNAPSSQIEKTMDIMRSWGPLLSAFGVAVGSAIMGAIVSLITAAILKKERSPLDIAESAVDPE
ncbi:DUF4199 domain-containing protein [Mucilaginibacter calamicampi]|uniref:DUF4199 domain-containing protein n=1 Tax=Mucilaginibacter calamicampi TaxID=1302352 RepID=A0ABW2YU99_9SPHI